MGAEGNVTVFAFIASRVLFKKGEPGDCRNHKLICLFNAAYKITAKIIFTRLEDAEQTHPYGHPSSVFRRSAQQKMLFIAPAALLRERSLTTVFVFTVLLWIARGSIRLL